MDRVKCFIVVCHAIGWSCAWFSCALPLSYGQIPDRPVVDNQRELVSFSSGEGARHTILDRFISLSLDGESLRQALHLLADRGNIRFFYDESIIPDDVQRYLQVEEATLREVLGALLEGTNLHFMVTARGQIVLFERSGRFSEANVSSSYNGRIEGMVSSEEPTEPLAGVNVVLRGTAMGTTSSFDGTFFMNDLIPGIYDLEASFVGYRPKIVLEVQVEAGATTTLELEMNRAEIGLSEMVVKAHRPVVERDVWGNVARYNRTQLAGKPFTGLEDIVSRQAGVEPGMRIRGGDLSELHVLMDGMSMRDGRDNGPFHGISYTAIEEIEVQTGGIDAEYGNLRSGIVKVITREGPKDAYTADVIARYSPPGSKNLGPRPNASDAYWIRPYTDPEVAFIGTGHPDSPWDKYIRNQYPSWQGWNTVSQLLESATPSLELSPEQLQEIFLWHHRKTFQIGSPDYEIDASFGGPVPGVGFKLGDLSFFGSFRDVQTAYVVPQTRDAHKLTVGQMKLSSNPSRGMKLVINGLYSREAGINATNFGAPQIFTGEMPRYSWDNRSSLLVNRLTREAIFTNDHWSGMDITRSMVGAELTHVVASNTHYKARIQRFVSEYSTSPGRPRDNTPVKSVGPVQLTEAPLGYDRRIPTTDYSGLRLQSKATAHDTSSIAMWSAGINVTTRVHPRIDVKGGLELIFSDYDVRYGQVDSLWVHHDNPHYRWTRRPVQGAAFVQNSFDIHGMVANIGLRLDYFNAGGVWYSFEPFDRNMSRIQDGKTVDTISEEAVMSQVALSPRIGVSFPTSANTKLYFNYGHFRQLLDPEALFGARRINTGAIDQFGDPNHPLPRTVSYEVGYEQNLFDQVLVRLSGYYTSASNEPSLVRFRSIDGHLDYSVTEPNHFRDTRGFEITVDKDRGRWIRGFVAYSHMVTKKGNFGFQSIYEDQRKTENVLREGSGPYYDWPIPEPYARMSLELITPPSFGPQTYGRRTLADWRLSLHGEWRSGQTFTWDGGGGQIPGLEKNVRWRDFYNFDFRISRTFSAPFGAAQLFVDVSNVLNLRHVNRYSAFVGAEDFRRYMLSLHLDEDAFEQLDQPPYTYIAGNDRPGDFRRPGVDFVPISIVQELPSEGHDGPTTVLYYLEHEQQYMLWQEGGWVEAPREFVDRTLQDKAYIDMPNNTSFTFLNPRRWAVGIRISI